MTHGNVRRLEKRAAVAANGDKAAQRFLDTWNWERYKKDCGGTSDGE